MKVGKISKRGNGPKVLENELPEGYVREDGVIYKVLENGSKITVEWTEMSFEELRGND